MRPLVAQALTVAIVGAFAPFAAVAQPRTFSFQTGEGFEYRGVIDLPPRGFTKESYAVLLLGGGLANDLDWSVPGSYTITGEAHADAPIISRALTDAGFIVARWSTIRVGDPKADKWPDEVTPTSYEQTLEQAKSALAAVRSLNLVAPDRIVLLGHSLGARRALNLCAQDGAIPGVVCLSGADLVRTGYDGQARKQELRGEAGRIHAEMDRTGDGRVETWEFQGWAPIADEHGAIRETDGAIPRAEGAFATIDADADAALRRWEIEARLALHTRSKSADQPAPLDSKGRPWGEEVLFTLPRALLLYGGQDPWSSQGVIVREAAAQRASPSVEVCFLPGLGHNLGPENEGRHGPVSPGALAQVVAWLDRGFPPRN